MKSHEVHHHHIKDSDILEGDHCAMNVCNVGDTVPPAQRDRLSTNMSPASKLASVIMIIIIVIMPARARCVWSNSEDGIWTGLSRLPDAKSVAMLGHA